MAADSPATDSWHAFFRHDGASCLLSLLLAGDLAFAVLHLLWYFGFTAADPLYSLEMDWGHAEVYQYTKEMWLALLCVIVVWRSRSARFLVWGGFFLYLLLDDASSLHERLGEWLAAQLNLVSRFGLRPADFGECMVYLATGGVLALALILAFVSGSWSFRRASIGFCLLMALFAGFGIGFDMLPFILKMGDKGHAALGFLEDVGEMASMSLIVWFAFLIMIRQGRLDFSLRDLSRDLWAICGRIPRLATNRDKRDLQERQ